MGHVRAFGDGTRRRPLETERAEAFECACEDPLAHLLPPLGLAFRPTRHGGPLTGMAFPDQTHCRTAPARRDGSRVACSLFLYPLATCRHTTCLSRSTERRVGEECDRTCRAWWAPDHYKQTSTILYVNTCEQINKQLSTLPNQ